MSPELVEVVPKSLEGFDAGMNDDLNTPRYAWRGFRASRARIRCAQSETLKSGARSGLDAPCVWSRSSKLE